MKLLIELLIVIVVLAFLPWLILQLKERYESGCSDTWHSSKRSEQECPTCGKTWKRPCDNDWHKFESISEPECPACGEDWKGPGFDDSAGDVPM